MFLGRSFYYKDWGGPHSLDKKTFLSYTLASLPDRQLLITPGACDTTVSPGETGLAVLASIQPGDNSAEGRPMAVGSGRFANGLHPPIIVQFAIHLGQFTIFATLQITSAN
jgi:hypothetical protein